MQHKVLLADDSLTIQKVIRITLSQQPYDIVDCSTEDELFTKLTHEKPRIVFLDFNLSDTHTGYELTSRIRELSPSTKVLLLLGTFDTIDDAAFEKCGASEKIVKPFDSNKFIAICKRLVEEGDEEINEEDNVFDSHSENDEEPAIDEDSQWTMNVPKKEKSLDKQDMSLDGSIPNLNPLQSEISSWGMSIPGVIDSSDSSASGMELPPVISDEKKAAELRPKLPNSDDLDYPSIDEVVPAPKSNLISIENFRTENDTQEYEIEGNFVPDESDVKNIEDQIKDEVEGDLWTADEFIDAKTEMEENIERAQSFSPDEEISQGFDESYLKPIDDNDSITWNEEETKKIPEKEKESLPAIDQATLERLIEKHVREKVDELFKEKVEKIAWEIIPDLAENLIRKELNSIAERIISQSK